MQGVWEMTPMRLRVSATAGDLGGLVAALESQAKAFFGESEYRLDGEIDVDASTEVSAAGQTLVITWEGTAHYVNWREKDYSGLL